ncbi:hypothetical protein U2261_29965 [Achromobacter xylosoxidans]|jgi:hypothetical protein|uniref:AtuA-like ferredoxin-fold domain-containing protein n=2 Tax=Alcaligenaceae TaxID=506 RepID=A0A2S5GP35_9BURK|nr:MULTISPECIES: hypothetical protein [Alcaligenaceae]MDD7991881.1 hypothetical protein [Achromobacter xylosoxidans]MDQ6211626.1 hypothetical protein [Achromobacter insolitus]MDZ5618874.1 hypothetical protein [Achromobacter xylosoxidans]MDZ5624574.1 hypothetical protein [Achromobacter xylosoxidans]MDZ5684840.1 hypothetical protein [Achromobacter xylosoxidans]
MTLQVKDIAYVRSGDKGDVCSVGLVARGPQEYAQLLASVTPADVKGLYGDWVQGEVECHPMDNIGAMMVIMRHALGGGATRTLRLDQTGKSLGHALLRLPVRDPS